MLYRFFLSKKGFTMMEMLIAVVVLGTLTAVAVPLLGNGLAVQRKKDCANQRVVIKSTFQEAMAGMMDSGKKQKTMTDKNGQIRYALNLNTVQGDHKTTYPGDGVLGNGDDAYVDQECLVLVYDQQIPGKIAFTLSDIRGGYGVNMLQGVDYNAACDRGNYLKKQKLGGYQDSKTGEWVPPVRFYEYLANQEIPVCPFADYDDNDKSNDYYYYILWNKTEDKLEVLCSCSKCNEVD